ncbi:MAG: methyltransferase domain-containing protein [Candidatus Omnitrophica bacterium]|nr:methyltransferase domain-containing protein [Candidatus Omnitrophota bacterium]
MDQNDAGIFGERIKGQFAARAEDFEVSANWVCDARLIRAHVEAAGPPGGEALDLCCGTGQVGRALKAAGWAVKGLDLCGEMAAVSSRYFPVSTGAAEAMPFASGNFQLVVCRQSFQFLNVPKVLAEIARVLVPGGTFILSLTVPFCGEDAGWLSKIHHVKQPLLLEFYTAQELVEVLNRAGFSVVATQEFRVRESVTQWMRCAPELNAGVRAQVVDLVKNAPAVYKSWHDVQVTDGDVLEDWNWVVLKTVFHPQDKG